MLKLMKYEFIHSMRSFFISFCVFWGACILLPFFSEGLIPDIPVLTFFVAFGFTVLVMGITIALFVSIFSNYYQSMFKRPGYLTLTLPVSSTKLIISKLIVSFLWLVIGGIVLLFGVLLTGIVSAFLQNNLSVIELLQGIPYVFKSFLKAISYDIPGFLYNLILLIVQVYFLIISIYFSLTIAHTKLCRHHRLLVGICIWIVLEVLVSWLQMGLAVIGITSDGSGIIIFNLITVFIGLALTMLTIYMIDHQIEIE